MIAGQVTSREDIPREALAGVPFFRNSGGEIHLPREGGWQLFIEMWSEAMLKVYLENLEEAETRDRNLLNKKYARMDHPIPALNDDGREFSVPLRCKLETCGDRTLRLHCENARNAEAHLASSGA